jgi:hypothetical protein
MKETKKIYLSLDDLHKLYGILPKELLSKRKKKTKKKKKVKKSTGTTKPFGSGILGSGGSGGGGGGGFGGVSSSIDRREIDILRGQINDAKNNPHKPENAGVLLLENVPEELKETFKYAKSANDALQLGLAKVVTTTYKGDVNGVALKQNLPKTIKGRKKKTIDISIVDKTLNNVPLKGSNNDMTNTQPLQYINEDMPNTQPLQPSNDDSDFVDDDVEDIPLEPINNLSTKKKAKRNIGIKGREKRERTNAQIEATQNMQQQRTNNITAGKHFKQTTLRNVFNALKKNAPNSLDEAYYDEMSDAELIALGKKKHVADNSGFI